ncbi:uncharacterized protein MONBRDRAFT_23916 [Monosiga brevicollis MX1]|uniref:C2H2-type domain-containing protein n=1 Tax=Monosiga brevicollis TaxID=81824 RepID=A9UV79_MONBE|nr:uncharacterized protein MONBRDRAFT_23916 [Monosiga brevicollis MX1]EDQ91033.1 predicted protein [Monosiga brevicollis MX1]|eukprot:XP_001744330.1 hypothetical protein [Monosiga brevicollis MX1]
MALTVAAAVLLVLVVGAVCQGAGSGPEAAVRGDLIELAQRCNQTESRRAMAALEQVLYPFQPLTPSESCPWIVEHDLFYELNRDADVTAKGQPACLFCGKAFENAVFLDQHYPRRHLPTFLDLPNPDRRLCLADSCDVLQCAAYSEGAELWAFAHQPCSPGQYDMAQVRCRATIDTCFPDHPQHAAMVERICGRLSCAFHEHLKHETRHYSGLEVTQLLLAVLASFVSLLFYLSQILPVAPPTVHNTGKTIEEVNISAWLRTLAEGRQRSTS